MVFGEMINVCWSGGDLMSGKQLIQNVLCGVIVVVDFLVDGYLGMVNMIE